MVQAPHNILVIGDLMLDRYIYGYTDRISPEAACPIFNESGGTVVQLGGAANVASQLRKAGNNVTIAGTVGDDWAGKELIDMLSTSMVDTSLVRAEAQTSTVKTRYVTHANQQVIRIDHEAKIKPSAKFAEDITNYLHQRKDEIDCIVMSDYDKGVLSTSVSQQVINLGQKLNIPTIVDIKVADISRYIGATIVKGNIKEINNLLNVTHESETELDKDTGLTKLRKRLQCKHFVVTCGKEGILGIDSDDSIVQIPSEERQIFDVTGAGDVVTVYLAIGIVDHLSFKDIIKAANRAANISITRLGTSYVSPMEVDNSTKLITAEQFNQIKGNRKVVFTNGCFDVLHAGHIDLLEACKAHGDILVVGLNTDDSIKRLKGPERPINTLDARVRMLAALSIIDYIITFDDDTPLKLIEQINPDVLAKGGDYTIDNIVGHEHVLDYGGKVITIPFKYNVSSSTILSKI